MSIVRSIFSFLLDTVQTFLLLASFFLVMYIFFFRPFEVSGQSMYPTFYDKEYVLTDLITIKFSELKRADVVVFVSPVEKDKDYIKRIIGVPGDSVFIKDGDVYVNNEKLNENVYLKPEVKTNNGSFLRDEQTVVVPKNQYFVLGDNRPHSADSRQWGFIKKQDIIGKSFFVYWPITRLRGVANPFNK